MTSEAKRSLCVTAAVLLAFTAAVAVRVAFADTFADKDFLAEGEKRRLGVDTPRDGKALQGLLERIYTTTSPEQIARLRKIQSGK